MSKSSKLGEELIFTALQILKENDGEMSGTELILKVGKRSSFDDWATTIYEKTGNIRWQSILYFHTIPCVKAGFLIKKKGIWYLTKDGEEALKLGKEGLFKLAKDKYKVWAEQNNQLVVEEKTISDEKENKESDSLAFEEAEQQANDSFSNHINSLDAYEFQDLCSALLRAMSYYTPFIAPRGKDGGVDIVAYRDPLGATTPRIKVQVKHRENKSTSAEVQQLHGALRQDDIGLFISSGGFTSDAIPTVKTLTRHVELIDMKKFIQLWIEFYAKMNEEDKALMPILPVYFVRK